MFIALLRRAIRQFQVVCGYAADFQGKPRFRDSSFNLRLRLILSARRSLARKSKLAAGKAEPFRTSAGIAANTPPNNETHCHSLRYRSELSGASNRGTSRQLDQRHRNERIGFAKLSALGACRLRP